MSDFTIADLRKEMNLSLGEFSALVGLAGRGNMSLIERGLAPPSVRIALEIERISTRDGRPRIDAAKLNGEVAASRRGCDCFHGSEANPVTATPSSGNGPDLTDAREAA
jgi:predicted transcriptional regulator